VRNGLDRSEALIFFGRKINAPSLAESVKKSLQNIPVLASLPQTEKVHFGRQAFEDWADSLLCDECFESEEMLVYPLDTYGSCIVLVGSNMHGVQGYLDRALELCPDMRGYIEQLKNAYADEMKALQNLVDFQGGYFFDADRKALLNKDFRISLAGLIREIGQRYENAARIS